ncbi:peptidyl-prolyl cis-trans isomerase [Salmonella enterica subsp. enterica serovar Havana]|nr:peptidyl-prolyl cis-trans isomerase [Salmonella enterica subsp. enterica serovar Havana]
MLKSTLAAVAAVFALSALSPVALAAKGDPHVLLTTSAGNIELELNSQKAPISVKTLSITSTVVSITTLRFTELFLAL